MYLDIHSHILYGFDDGAKDLNSSLALLNELKNQNVTDVILTPHFYPLIDTLDDFLIKREEHYNNLIEEIKQNPFPNIYLGCEILYYSGISNASLLQKFTLANSKYILLEPNFGLLNKHFEYELNKLKELGFKPIIAHIERYHKASGYKSFLKFAKENDIPLQVNATSFFTKHYTHTLKKLIKEDLICYIASDTHSVTMRPPMIKDSLCKIGELYGEEYREKLISRSMRLLNEITHKEPVYDIKKP